MHIHDSLHIVALDNCLNQGFSLLIVWLLILNTLCLECQNNKYLFDTFALISLWFLFLFLLLHVGALDDIF